MVEIHPSPAVEIQPPSRSVNDSRMLPLGVSVREMAALPVGPVDPVPASTVPPSDGVMKTTNLGILLVQANHNASASSVLAPIDKKASRAAQAQYTQDIVATAPSNQSHGNVWGQIIDACKQSAKSVEINGITITAPSLVSLDEAGHLLEVSLTSGLGDLTSGGSITASTREAPSMLKSSDTKEKSSQSVTVPVPALFTKPAINNDPKSLTPQGFVIGGGINLFGMISAQMYSFHGTASSGMDELVVVTGGSAQEPGTISVGTIIPTLKDTVVDDVQFQKTHLAYYSTASPIDGRIGTWLEADTVLKGSLSTFAGDILHFFNIEDPMAHIESRLSLNRIWTESLQTPSFMFSMSHQNLTHKFNDEVTFLSATIDIAVRCQPETTATPSSCEWTLGFNGELSFILPGSITPLLMTFHILKQDDTFQLLFAMTKEPWQNAFGVQGLTMSAVQFSGSYHRVNQEKASVSFDIAATVDIGGMEFHASGFYHNSKAWGFTLDLDTFTWSDLCGLYQSLFQSGLRPFDHHEDVAVSELVMAFSAGAQTFTLSAKLKIHDYESANATITLSPDGISATADVGDIKFGDVIVKEGKLDLFVGKDTGVGSGTPAGLSTKFHISGTVEAINGFKVSVLVYFDKDANQLFWTIFGQFQDHLTLGSLTAAARNELNLPLPNLAFVASNSTSPPSSLPVDFRYPVEKGVQLCASIGSLDWLNKALHSTQSNLMLQVHLTKDDLDIVIQLDAPQMKLSFAPNVKSGPLRVGIDLPKGKTATLFIETDISISTANQLQPLDFSLRLDLTDKYARGTAQLKSDWIDPLGISKKLTIGEVVLQLGIIYVSEFYPSELGFGGHIMMGDTGAKVAIEISDDPREGLLVVELDEGKHLGLIDLVKFANTILEADRIPIPPSDYFVFDEFKLDASTGMMFVGTYYPAGIVFKSVIELFGKKLAIDCEINKATRSIRASGTIENFTLGPLTVSASKNQSKVITGAPSKPPTGPIVDLEFGESKSHILVDGEIKIGDIADIAITMSADIGEKPQFYFEASLDFMDHLQFTLIAEAKGDISHIKHGAAGLDFNLHAELKQDILKQIVAQLNTMLLAAKHAADEGFNDANTTLKKAEDAFQQGVKNAQNDLKSKKAIWDAKLTKEQTAADKKKAEIAAQRAGLQKDVDNTKQAFDKLIKGLEDDVAHAEQQMTAKITNSQSNVAKEQATWDAKLNKVRKDLSDAHAAMARDFGHADSAISSAEARVKATQNDLGGINAQIDRERAAYNSASFFAKVGKKILIAGLEVQRGLKEAACRVADEALRVAREVVQGVGYATAQKAIDLASASVDVIQKDADAALRDVNKTLDAVRTEEQRLCDAARNKLESARTSCDELKMWNVAKAALSTFVSTETALYSAASTGVLALESTAEKVAYDAATVALKIAMANTHDLDIARHAVDAVKDGTDAFLAVGQKMLTAAGDFVDVQSILLSGSLKALTDANAPQPLDAKVQLIFLGNPHTFEVKFQPGGAASFVKQIFNECWAAVKKAI